MGIDEFCLDFTGRVCQPLNMEEIVIDRNWIEWKAQIYSQTELYVRIYIMLNPKEGEISPQWRHNYSIRFAFLHLLPLLFLHLYFVSPEPILVVAGKTKQNIIINNNFGWIINIADTDAEQERGNSHKSMYILELQTKNREDFIITVRLLLEHSPCRSAF